uniref:L-Fucosyltransferase n=1 Tax=Canis lupus familiaris TaxID=9615 RepID=A0A8C0N8B6_CANLF
MCSSLSQELGCGAAAWALRSECLSAEWLLSGPRLVGVLGGSSEQSPQNPTPPPLPPHPRPSPLANRSHFLPAGTPASHATQDCVGREGCRPRGARNQAAQSTLAQEAKDSPDGIPGHLPFLLYHLLPLHHLRGVHHLPLPPAPGSGAHPLGLLRPRGPAPQIPAPGGRVHHQLQGPPGEPDGITLPVLHGTTASKIPWQNYHLNDWMEEEYRHIPGEYVRLTGYPCSWTFYHHLRHEILREFTLHDHVREEAQKFLRGLQVNGRQPGTFVGVHVRRGDYVQVMPNVWKGVVADQRYLEQALDWFRTRYNSPIFVVTSNGMAWCRQNINSSRGDVVFAGNGIESSPAKDFALLTQCNHTIMTIGTFGIWAAYLAGGETIYLANYTLPDSPFLKIFKPEAAFLPEWVGIAADLSPLLKH